MDYYTFTNENEQEICNPDKYSLQYILRLIILGLAFSSSLFIFYVCLQPKLCKYFTFKILLLQSCFEMIDLALAIAFDEKLVSQKTMQDNCFYIGYIMHASWISSFICCFLMAYFQYTMLQIDNKYQLLIKYQTYLFISVWILPYICLLYPFLKSHFVPTGWHVKNDKCQQYFFCGFDSNIWIYLIFWTVPQAIIFGSAINYSRKNQLTVFENDCLMQQQEIQFIKQIQTIPRIYSISWAFNQFIRYVDLIQPIQHFFISNPIAYFIYLIFNLGFELHLCFVLFFFIKYYRKLQYVDFFWLCRPSNSTKVEQQQANLLYNNKDSTITE